MLMLLALACSRPPPVTTAEHAPFELTEFGSQLWLEDPNNGDGEGTAILVLAEGELDCASFTRLEVQYELEELVLNGEGLMFVLQYRDRDSEAPPEWEGLWIGGYGYGFGDVSRSLAPLAFQDGTLYLLGGDYGDGSDWLRVDERSADGAAGAFSTEWWQGAFDAIDCGTWKAGPQDTGGWDSWPDTDSRETG